MASLPQIKLDEASITMLTNGQAIPLRPEHPRPDLAQAVTFEGQFIAPTRLAAALSVPVTVQGAEGRMLS